MNRLPHEGLAAGSLFLLHGLADLAVNVLRFHDADSGGLQVVAAALPRSQVCLLAAWLVIGQAKFSWRACGFLAGLAFIFSLFTRGMQAELDGVGVGAVWLEAEWRVYFQLARPGDLLVKAPMLIGVVSGGLLLWQLVRGWRPQKRQTSPFRWPTMRFGLADVALWILTISIVMMAAFRTTPYPEWYEELWPPWRLASQFLATTGRYAMLSASLYAVATLVSLSIVFSGRRWYLRLLLGLLVAGTPLPWLPGGEQPAYLLALLCITGSLLLVKLYRQLLAAATS